MKPRFMITAFIILMLFCYVSFSFSIEGTWEKKADVPTARCAMCSSVANGKIYVFGG